MVATPKPGSARGRAQAAFTRRILPAMTALLVFTVLAAAAALAQIATKLDKDALDQGRFLVGVAFDNQQQGMQRVVADNAFWGDAYANLHRELDINWAFHQKNLGPSLYQDFGYDAVLVLDGQRRTRYSVMRGELQPIEASQWLQGLPHLLDQAGEAVQREEAVVGLLQVNGVPAMVAAAIMTTAGSDVEPVPGAPSTLLFVDVLDAPRLLELGATYRLEGLRLATGAGDEALLERTAASGELLRFTWIPDQPGRQLLWRTLPILAIVAAGLSLLAWLLLRQGFKTVRILDASHTRLASSRAALAISEKRFRDVAESASDWLWEINRSGRLTYLSERFEEITGHTRNAWLGQPLAKLLNLDPTTLEGWLTTPGSPLRGDYRAAHGGQRDCRLSARAILLNGVTIGHRGTVSDITEETRAQARIQYLSQHDALTGLPNRSRLHEHLTSRLQGLADGRERLTLLYIDLDRFKPVNDTLGHAAGDEVLIGVADRLRQCVRSDDMVARIGGDEFVMVISRLRDRDDISQLCARLLESLSQVFHYEQHEVFIGASIGVAIAPDHSSQPAELLRYADLALYRAKHNGRGRWHFYCHEMGERLYQRGCREAELQDAIDAGQFELHYQPRYRNGETRIVGVEALLRWQHPQRGLLLPEHFIPLAEETGQMVALGEWALREACREASNWPEDALVSVNLSPSQLRNGNLLETVSDALRQSGLPARRLELEITESALLQESEEGRSQLSRIRALGVRLSMDNFGAGYSSLSTLRNHPFDLIKIDRSFVSELPLSSEDRSVIHALASLSRGLGFQLVAEGVETAEQLAMLCAEGCSEAQGFYLQRPVPATEIRSLMARQPQPAQEPSVLA